MRGDRLLRTGYQMKITYRLTFEDYDDAARARNAKDRRIRAGAALGMSVLLFGYWMASGRNAQVGHAWLLLATFVVVIYLLFRWIDKLRFRKAYQRGSEGGFDRNELIVDISEDGIKSSEASNIEEWSYFSKYSESNNAFILYRANSIHAIFPKRAFDVDGMDSFRRLLQAKLGRS